MTNLPDIATIIPGYVGMVSEMRARIETVGESEIPNDWTPEHVGVRMIEAFDILQRSGARVGPRQHANGWPAMVHEFADMIDAQARALAEMEKQQARAARPTADELSRMNEALAWPMAYLDGRALASDSLMFWAYASATGRDMAGMLHHRKKRATALAEEMERRANRLPYGTGDKGEGDCRSLADQWRAALRRQIARDVAAEANEALAAGLGAERVNRIAQAALRERVEEANCLPYRFKPHDAVPGRVLSRTNLDRQRKIAMAAVADGLRRARVAVR